MSTTLEHPLSWRINRAKSLLEVKGVNDADYTSLGVSPAIIEEKVNKFKGAKIIVEASDNKTYVTDNRANSEKLYKLSEIKSKNFLFDGSFTIQSEIGFAIGYIEFLGHEPSTDDWCPLNSHIVNLHNHKNDYTAINFSGNNVRKDSIFKTKTKADLHKVVNTYNYFGNLNEEVDIFYDAYKFVVHSFPIFFRGISFSRIDFSYEHNYRGRVYFKDESSVLKSIGFQKELSSPMQTLLNTSANEYYIEQSIPSKTLSRLSDNIEGGNNKFIGYLVADNSVDRSKEKLDFNRFIRSDISVDTQFISTLGRIEGVIMDKGDLPVNPHIIFLDDELFELYNTDRDNYFEKATISALGYGENTLGNNSFHYEHIDQAEDQGDGDERVCHRISSYRPMGKAGGMKIAVLFKEGQLLGNAQGTCRLLSEENSEFIDVDFITDSRNVFNLGSDKMYISKPINFERFDENGQNLKIYYGQKLN